LGLLVAASAASGGCIIGTWPTPEETPNSLVDVSNRGKAPTGNEACNDVDDDGDGSVDEGCPCEDVARGCVGIGASGCGFGVQWCADGVWQECSDIGPPYSPVHTPRIDVVSVSPDPVVRGDTPAVVIVAEPTARCRGIAVPSLLVTLASSVPVMRVHGVAKDNGKDADDEAADGAYSASLPNPFGPGVEAQTLTIQVEGIIDNRQVMAASQVPLEVQ